MATVKGERRATPRDRITSKDVIAAAIDIVDRDGVDRLTIRRVADACGLSPMGVYRHVRSKDDLLDQIVDTVVTSSIDEVRVNGAWDRQIVQLFRHARQLFLQHRGVAVLCVLRPTPVAGVARFYDRVLAALEEGGLEGQAAVHAFDTLLMYMFGSVTWEIPRSPDIRQRLLTVALDDDSTPHLVARATDLSQRDPEKYYEAGLRVILDGLDKGRRRPGARPDARSRSRAKPSH